MFASKRLAPILAAALITACSGTRRPSTDPPISEIDGDYPPPGGVVEVFPDGSPEALKSPCGRACSNLAFLNCPEGKLRGCYRGCLSQAQHVRVPTGCWTLAKAPTEVRDCGLIRCEIALSP